MNTLIWGPFNDQKPLQQSKLILIISIDILCFQHFVIKSSWTSRTFDMNLQEYLPLYHRDQVQTPLNSIDLRQSRSILMWLQRLRRYLQPLMSSWGSQYLGQSLKTNLSSLCLCCELGVKKYEKGEVNWIIHPGTRDSLVVLLVLLVDTYISWSSHSHKKLHISSISTTSHTTQKSVSKKRTFIYQGLAGSCTQSNHLHCAFDNCLCFLQINLQRPLLTPTQCLHKLCYVLHHGRT